ncbi:MAG: hypothetical protein IT438_01080 [Phycisphaerales bacterium]|nr:hypothetical protein [Phycisphaerales bacterium]
MRTNTLLFAVSISVGLFSSGASAQPIGERPVIERHIDQTNINRGRLSLDDLRRLGKALFDAKFNVLDGQGRPATTGGGAPRVPDQPEMIRTSGPDSSSCAGCHAQPRSGGAGDFVANVFVLAQTLDPVTESVSGAFSNERNTLGMMGSGPIEMLAREMSVQLGQIRERARADAQSTGQAQRRELRAKGIRFGHITVLPDGKIDPAEIQGVDWDLIVKPFNHKGAVASLREFTNNAMNHHHGMQPVERFGRDTDPDQDGVTNELTVGDITAVTLYQAALNVPQQVIPPEPVRRAAVVRGEEVFRAIGCAECHRPTFVLESREFTEPNPYNQPGDLRPQDVPRVFSYDMTAEGEGPYLERLGGGRAIVRPFTDLKRHDITDGEMTHYANEQVPQGRLNGFAPASDFTIPPPVRPTAQFLTRKLWDAGNSAPYGHRGDLSTLTEAIKWHGGEARQTRDTFMTMAQHDRDCVIEFLKSLQVVEPTNP